MEFQFVMFGIWAAMVIALPFMLIAGVVMNYRSTPRYKRNRRRQRRRKLAAY